MGGQLRLLVAVPVPKAAGCNAQGMLLAGVKACEWGGNLHHFDAQSMRLYVAKAWLLGRHKRGTKKN